MIQDSENPFPSPMDLPEDESVLCVSQGVCCEWLFHAYRQGVFPWPFAEDDWIPWSCPNPRAILRPEKLRFGHGTRKALRRIPYRVTFDAAFPDVIRACSDMPRRGEGTWIFPFMIDAYIEAHEYGFAHSVEVWDDDELVGGCYGIFLHGVFSGESLFHRAPHAGNLALQSLANHLHCLGCPWIDIQQDTEHMMRVGAERIPRIDYLRMLEQNQVGFPEAATPFALSQDMPEHGEKKTTGNRWLKFGGGYRDRTDDLLNAIQTLSQLS